MLLFAPFLHKWYQEHGSHATKFIQYLEHFKEAIPKDYLSTALLLQEGNDILVLEGDWFYGEDSFIYHMVLEYWTTESTFQWSFFHRSPCWDGEIQYVI